MLILSCVFEGQLSKTPFFVQSDDPAEPTGTPSVSHRYLIIWKLEPYHAKACLGNVQNMALE